MGFNRIIRQTGRDSRGAALIEFALVAPLFFFFMLCLIEIGLLLFSQVALESATMAVSRSSSICNKAGNCAQMIRDQIYERTHGLINGDQVVVELNPLSKGGVSIAPDMCQTNPPSMPGTAADGSCVCPGSPPQYFDNNNNGICDAPGGVDAGVAGDLVEIRATYPWKLLIPFLDRFSFLGAARDGKMYGNRDGYVVLSASTVIKNEPQ
jgi:hypothetical protein